MGTDSHGSRARWALTILVFGAVYLALYGAYQQIPNAILGDRVYHPFIAAPGADLIRWLAPADPVQALSNRIVSGNTVLEVVRGCDGAGVLFLLIAAILSVRGPLLRVVGGLLGALAFVYVVNQVRIVVLYFAIARHGDWFVPLHAAVFPTLFVALGLIYFSVWLSFASAPPSREPIPAA